MSNDEEQDHPDQVASSTLPVRVLAQGPLADQIQQVYEQLTGKTMTPEGRQEVERILAQSTPDSSSPPTLSRSAREQQLLSIPEQDETVYRRRPRPSNT